ncbi:MAG: Type 1 glutamine amidotransferase-like domain-containing protein [Dysgonomonas sp.]
MKKRGYILFLLFLTFPFFIHAQKEKTIKQDEQIFVFGGDINKKFVQYIVELTNKSNPKICFVPTASADSKDNIEYWEFICKTLSLEPHVLKVWVNSYEAQESFEDILLSMDAIVVGGGNTLNMMGIWKAQGIDKILTKALGKGIILAGGSAGSICWFRNGISDSRPKNLSIVNGLGFLPYSNCPHYSDSLKRETYHQKIKDKKIKSGYALDDLSGILFKNGKFAEVIQLDEKNNAYYVTLKNNKIVSDKLNTKIFVSKDALAVGSYESIIVDKTVKDFVELSDKSTPLNSFISIKYIFATGKDSKYIDFVSEHIKARLPELKDNSNINEKRKNEILDTPISRVLIYNNSLAGIISKAGDDLFGLWFFYKENNEWRSAGEDIGGSAPDEAEITFREKADMHLKKIQTTIIKE